MAISRNPQKTPAKNSVAVNAHSCSRQFQRTQPRRNPLTCTLTLGLPRIRPNSHMLAQTAEKGRHFQPTQSAGEFQGKFKYHKMQPLLAYDVEINLSISRMPACVSVTHIYKLSTPQLRVTRTTPCYPLQELFNRVSFSLQLPAF